ncbi:AhpC/TSA family protein [Ramicandelaber brevisporus]|nr:AhpC/TSA family protein [Ramicandelaber brevisporus]
MTLVQKPAPHFSTMAVVNGSFDTVSLDQFKGRWLVLAFYPLDFTFACPSELVAFSDRAAEFKALNADVCVCSVDSEYTHLAWTSTPRAKGGVGEMQIPMLADVTKKIARDYGVLIESEGVALRGLFIIDPQGIVRIEVVHDLPIGRSVDETLRVVQALQFHEKYGDVCPANWQPGDEGLKTTLESVGDYMQKKGH